MNISIAFLLLAIAGVFGHECNEYCSSPAPEGCCERFGFNLYRDSDVVLSASTEYDSNHGVQRSGLFTPDTVASWSAQVNDGNQWIGVDFGQPRKVTGVLLQGRGDCCDQWVTSFRVLFSDDGEVFYSTEPIVGTFDRHTVARRYFDRPITARYVRLNPIAWNNHISLRFDLIGCEDDLGHHDHY